MRFVDEASILSVTDGMAGADESEPETWDFEYNADGLRTKRTNGTTTYTYIHTGDQLTRMTVGSSTLNFAHDASGIPMSVDYNGTDYYYVTNIQGDVVVILNTSGAAVVEYTYDAWGNIHDVSGSLADTLGETNPLRYRGYVYDTEIGFYYLQSRYYNPKVGRFINADAFASTGQGILGNNMFAYCNNNPILFVDPTGHAIWGTNTVAICDGGCRTNNNPFYWNDLSRPYYADIEENEASNAARRILEGSFCVKYKETWVFRVPFMKTSACSFGWIFMGSDINYDKYGLATLNHEYGHYVQLSQIGWSDYISKIAVPSLIGFWFPKEGVDYYSQPWEYTADLFGNVNRYWHTYSENAHENAMVYWESIVNGQ